MDWIIPLLIIGVSLYRWWNNLKQQEQRDQGRNAAPEPMRDDWDELLEALGQKPTAPKPAPVSIPEPPPLPILPPPPVVKRSPSTLAQSEPEEEGPTWRESVQEHRTKTFVDEQESFVSGQLQAMKTREQELAKHLEQLLEQNKKNASIKTAPPLQEANAENSKYRFNRNTLRQAWITKEILDPPLSLR